MTSEHGRLGYRRGCRCSDCKAGIAAYQAERRLIRQSTAAPFTHGTVSGYTNNGCRCSECRRAQANAVQAYRTRPLLVVSK